MHVERLAGPLEANDDRERRAQRRREILQPLIGGEDVLDVLGIDLESVGESDHVLLPPVQPEESILVEFPEVAGVEPLAVERGARCLLVLPVPLEHVRTLREDLAVVGDLHLDARHRDADRSEAVAVEPVERESG